MNVILPLNHVEKDKSVFINFFCMVLFLVRFPIFCFHELINFLKFFLTSPYKIIKTYIFFLMKLSFPIMIGFYLKKCF